LKPKCFREADLPKQRSASNAIWVQRSLQDEVIEDLERLAAESPYLFIACNVSFPIGNSQNVILEHLFSIGNWPVVELCEVRRRKVKFCPINTQLFRQNSYRAYCQNLDSIALIRYRFGYYTACSYAPQLCETNYEARTLIHLTWIRAEVSLASDCLHASRLPDTT
jgi:hypothetical protein